MNERNTLRSTRSPGGMRLRLAGSLVLFIAVAVVTGVFWRTFTAGAPGGATHDAHGGTRKIKYWWDPMMTPPFIADAPGKSPMGMDLVPVYEEGAAPSPGGSDSVTTYYCPMHPTYTSDHPGDCPICNMRLLPMKDGPQITASGVEGHATVTIDAARQQLIGVRFGVVESKSVQASIRAVGRVEYDERRLSSVNLKFAGFIEELFVKSVGEEVKAGDPLFSIYSPELMEAQRNYVLALASAPPNGQATAGSLAFTQATLRSARERLLLLDLTEAQIHELELTREVQRVTTIFSKSAGIVTQRNLVQGSAIEPGRALFELADLSTVWVHADVYEYELPLVRVGLKARVELPSQQGDPILGDVVFVYPYLNEATRTARVRVEIQNDERKLKPGMFATLFIASELGEQLVIDDQAVLDTGTRQLVFVDLGAGRFEPRKVRLGQQADGQAVVLEGLAEGERVVVSGNFLVDSESRLKSALLQGTKPASSAHAGHEK